MSGGIRSEETHGTRFDPVLFEEARIRTRSAIHEIAAAMRPGMNEEEGHAIALDILRQSGLRRGWHKPLLRFGPNTLCDFNAASQPDVVLGEDDIFFIDIGPVWKGHEGDGGETFTTGSDPAMTAAVQDVRALFDLGRRVWREEGLSGTALYGWLDDRATAMGWRLNLDMSGHRLSDFPHAVKHDGALADADFTPSSDIWVLEVQIRHPHLPFGGFYEDILRADDD